MLVTVFLGAMLSPQSGKELAKNKNVRLEGQTWNITDTDTHTHTHTHILLMIFHQEKTTASSSCQEGCWVWKETQRPYQKERCEKKDQG